MPSFSYSIDEGLAFVPKLKDLRNVSIFSFPLEDNDVLTQRIYDFVNNNPGAFRNAYWDIAAVRVYV